ncbi:SgcJ/EcaC family oxidoreductase [Actinokineospora guangxiensis]|uniref:SgcJ/EcaC family oxidoreductase n=1 Tax=Actinokineospora guangxiensis TaxID=1490288 RepID=A0ABW0EU66_9PSEU
MTNKAANLVDQAKQWAGYYGDFSNGPEGAVLTVPLRVRAAWDANDAEAFASIFAANGSMLAGDEQLNGPDAIKAYMEKAFAAYYQGTKLDERPVEIRFLTEDVAFAVTEGGVIGKDDTEVPEAERTRSTWVVARQDGDWRLVSRQTSPIG